MQAAELAGGKGGLVGYLRLQAAKNPGPFMALLGKVLPMQIANPEGEAFKTEEMGAAKLAAFLDGIAERSREDG